MDRLKKDLKDVRKELNETKDEKDLAIREKDKLNVDISKLQKDLKNLRGMNERAKEDQNDSEAQFEQKLKKLKDKMDK